MKVRADTYKKEGDLILFEGTTDNGRRVSFHVSRRNGALEMAKVIDKGEVAEIDMDNMVLPPLGKLN